MSASNMLKGFCVSLAAALLFPIAAKASTASVNDKATEATTSVGNVVKIVTSLSYKGPVTLSPDGHRVHIETEIVLPKISPDFSGIINIDRNNVESFIMRLVIHEPYIENEKIGLITLKKVPDGKAYELKWGNPGVWAEAEFPWFVIINKIGDKQIIAGCSFFLQHSETADYSTFVGFGMQDPSHPELVPCVHNHNGIRLAGVGGSDYYWNSTRRGWAGYEPIIIQPVLNLLLLNND